jgi:ABC-type glutathione transport system ATPase component
MASDPLLSVSLSVDYPTRPGILKNVFFQIGEGEVLGLVGESGSGKSTIALAILKLLSLKGGKAQGCISLRGRDLLPVSEREMRKIRGRDIGLVLQSPMSSLNPALRIGTQIAEAWKSHAKGSRRECRENIETVLARVGLPCDDEFLRRYPSQLSVGQAQRVLIAMAVIHRPALLIADEPTSALDAITQSEIMSLFRELNRSIGTSIIYISHDLPSVISICDRLAILHQGGIVECGTAEQVLNRPVHSYTKRLLSCVFPSGLAGTCERLESVVRS